MDWQVIELSPGSLDGLHYTVWCEPDKVYTFPYRDNTVVVCTMPSTKNLDVHVSHDGSIRYADDVERKIRYTCRLKRN